MDLGFASLAKLDEGWFGKGKMLLVMTFPLGIYFTSHPEYALRYCKPSECLIMCYLIVTNPYPVIYDDATSTSTLKLYGKGNYKHYGCHYVPVVPYGNESSTMDFRPPQKGT